MNDVDPDGTLPTTLTLADLLCFELHATTRAITQAYRPLLERYDLTLTQFLVLVTLWERGPAPIKDVAAALRLDHGTLTPLLRRMERAGHLTRQRNPADERQVLLSLTEAGESIRPESDRIFLRVGSQLGLDADERATLRALLQRMRHSLDRHAEPDEAPVRR